MEQQQNDADSKNKKAPQKSVKKDAVADKKMSTLFDEQSLQRDVSRVLQKDGIGEGNQSSSAYHQIKFQNVSRESNSNIQPEALSKQNDQATINLINKLDVLIEASHSLKNGLNETTKQLEINKKQITDNHEEIALKISSQLTHFQSQKDEVSKELEEKQIKVELTTVTTTRKKQELLTLKQFQDQLLQEMVSQNDDELKKKNLILKDLGEKVDNTKQLGKKERERRREIEENLETLEDQSSHLKITLGEFDKNVLEMSNLDHTQADFDKEKVSQMRLNERVRDLKKQLEDAKNSEKTIVKNENDISEEKAKQLNMNKMLQNPEQNNNEELRLRLEKLKNSNKQQFDEYLMQTAALNGLTVQVQILQSKKIELTEIANLLKDQNQFEKLSRKLQIKIESIEDQQRSQEDLYKEVQVALKQIESEIKVTNETLEKELNSFSKNLEKCVQDKEELEQDTNDIMSKVCNKQPQELKIDQIEQNLQSLLSHESQIDIIEKRIIEQRQILQIIITKYFDYEALLKNEYFKKSGIIIKENDSLISQIGLKLRSIQERIAKLEDRIKGKDATPDTDDQIIVIDQIKVTIQSSKGATTNIMGELENEKNKLHEMQELLNQNQGLLVIQLEEKKSLERIECCIGEFVGLFRDATEQNERLNKVLLKDIKDDLEQKVHDCEGQLDQFVKDKINIKEDNCNRDVKDGHLLSKQVDDKIHKLEERLEMLNNNWEKADAEDKQEIKARIDTVQKEVSKLKDEKKKLDNELDKIMSSTQDDKALLDKKQKEIDNIINKLDAMINPDIKDKEESIERIEEDLRDAIRKRRKSNRDKCMKLYDQATKGMKDFNNQMDKINLSIDQVQEKIAQFQKMYNYPDLERTQEQNEDLVKKIDEEKLKYDEMNMGKQQLQNKANNLQKGIEEIQSLLLSCPTLTNDNIKDKNLPTNDEIVQKWDDYAQKSKEVLKEVQDAQQKASLIQDSVDTINQVSDELLKKYKQKNKLYCECMARRKELEDKTQAINGDLDVLEEGNLEQISQILSKIVVPKNNQDFDDLFRNKLEDLESQKAKVKDQKEKIKEIEDKLNAIGQKLDSIDKEIVATPELQDIKNQLDKLKLEFNYQKEQLSNLEIESKQLLKDVKLLEQKNKSLLEQDVDATQNNLNQDLTYLNSLDKITADLLQQYTALIKQGLEIDDEQVKSHLTDLQEQSHDIERDLEQMRKVKKNIIDSERHYRKSLRECKSDLKNSSPLKLTELISQFEEIAEQCKSIKGDFENIKVDIEKRLKYLQDYLSKYNDRQSMFSDLIKELNKTKKNFEDINKEIASAELSSLLLKQVLSEMLKGITNDYQTKDKFITDKMNEIEAIDENIKMLKQKRNDIDLMMGEITYGGDSGMNDMSQDEIPQQISYAQKVQEQIKQTATECYKTSHQLNMIKSDIGEADLVKIYKVRETGLEIFTQTLKQVEQQFQEVKRYITSNDSMDDYEQFEQDLKDIDMKLQVSREERVQFKHELSEDLYQSIFVKRNKLKDLKSLSECIAKIIIMGIAMKQSLEMLHKQQLLAENLKNQVEGQDLMNRLLNLKRIENNERERIKVETLLVELHEIEEKEQEALDECDRVVESLNNLRKEVDSEHGNGEGEEWVGQILNNLDGVKGQLEKNEKTIVFLEKLALNLETHFIEMDVMKKLEKRSMELNELQSICDDFNKQLLDLETHLVEDIQKLDANKKVQGAVVMNMFVDEKGKPVNLLEEISVVQDDLKEVLNGVYGLQDESIVVNQKREAVVRDFLEKILSKSPFKQGFKGQVKSIDEVFVLLRQNGIIKKKIIDLIKSLKTIRNRMKEHKQKYQAIRLKIEKQNKPKKFYKAIKGDLVDELFADYINQLNCPVPITRLGNNQYTFGTKKIFAKVVNGKLVIRVGGGYMGIEEFMMYYGDQELTRLQKQEGFVMDEDRIGILDDNTNVSDYDEFNGGGGTGDNMGSSRSGRKSSMERACDIDLIKEKVRQQSAKKHRAKSPYADKQTYMKEQEEEKANKNDGRTQIVGLGDVRKAMKQNLVEIKTYQEHVSVSNVFTPMGKLKSSKLVDASEVQIQKHLRNVERRVGEKLKSQVYKEDLLSPSAKKLKMTTESTSKKPTTTSQIQKSTYAQKQLLSQQSDISRRSIQSEKGSTQSTKQIKNKKADPTKSPTRIPKKI